MKKNIYDKLIELLFKNERYVSDDGKLLKSAVYSDIMTMNEELLSLLFSSEILKKKFFSKIGDNYVFDKQGFAWFVEAKEFLPDSYTIYSNKIGLNSSNKFIDEEDNIVLDFPYKDCVLEGGQSREEQKREEKFYNETIAADEITRMLSPKVFGNAKRYSLEGVEENVKLNDNDNLIIKGNNLIGISSLLEKYEGKIKLIIIDPPYNTNTDSFKYNDRFSHSTWLVFMKNRLEIAKRLLSNDGSIYVQIDNKEAHYLKVLMDEVFGRNNFRSEIIWDTSIPYVAGNKWLSNNWIYSYSSIFYYAKNKENVFFNKLKFDVLQKSGDISKKPFKDVWSDIKRDIVLDSNEDVVSSSIEIILNSNYSDVWCDIENFAGFLGAKDIKIDFNSRKPEKLLERIIKASSDEGDIVLDFFGGSGTTLAAAHKMNRKYIGIEQMDNQIEIIVNRLKDVIDGDPNGISKSVNWKKGGSFVYCELLENSQSLINEILSANEDNIGQIKEKIYNDNRIVSYISRNELVAADSDFSNLSFEEKKKVLLYLVDKNKLYINYSDINDEEFNISDNDKKFTESFYGGE